MKKQALILILLFGLVICTVFAQEAPAKGLKQISEPLLKEYIDFLASDEMRGRTAPSEELDKSADYIASQLKSFGIKPVQGSFFQEIPFCSADLDVQRCAFLITRGAETVQFALKTNFTPLFNTGTDNVKGELVFAGYGITAPEYGYDDYENLDVKGKIVLVMKNEPQKNDENSVFDGKKETRYTNVDYKLQNAAAHGAAGFLFVSDPVNSLAITAQGHLWNSLYLKGKSKPSYNVCQDDKKQIPTVQVDRNVIEAIFGSVDSLKTLQRNIDETLHPQSFCLPETTVTLSVSIEKNEFPTKNVIGWIEGADPALKNEYLVIGAHYDHIGTTSETAVQNDTIMNGADDNASGTAAVMAIAKAFSASGKKPSRSVVFMFFTAEERGLIGSDYYTKNPLFPLNKTVAMLNLDMVGRNGNDTLHVVGEKLNPDLAALVNLEIPKVELKKTEMGMDIYSASDHFPFYQKGISAIALTSGLHKDYHAVSDNPDKINHVKVRKIAQLAYRVAWKIANSNNYYTIIEK